MKNTKWKLVLSTSFLILSACSGTNGNQDSKAPSTQEPASSVPDTPASVEEQHVHAYGAPVWNWTPNIDGSYGATATFTCTLAGEAETVEGHSVTVKADVNKETKAEPTCTVAGEVDYTATVTFESKRYQDVKKETLDATGHSYGDPVFAWTKTEDGYSAKATFTCTVEGEADTVEGHKVTVDATVSSAIAKEATCEEAASTNYVATANFEGHTYTETKVETTGDPLGHTYVKTEAADATYDAAGNAEYYTCSVCGKHFDSEKHEIPEIPTKEWLHLAAVDPTEDTKGIKSVYRHVTDGTLQAEAPEGVTDIQDYTLTDDQATAIRADEANIAFLIPSFAEVKAALGGHDGTMPYDGTFVDSAYAMTADYSDAAKSALAATTDVAGMYTTYHAHYGTALSFENNVKNESFYAKGTTMERKVNSELGVVTDFDQTKREDAPAYTELHFSNTSMAIPEDDGASLVVYFKGQILTDVKDNEIKNWNYRPDTYNNTSDWYHFSLTAKDSEGTTNEVQSTLIEHIGRDTVAVYFQNDIDLLAEGTDYRFTYGNVRYGCWDKVDYQFSDIYYIKSSALLGGGAAFENKHDLTQAYNNYCFDGSLGWNDSDSKRNINHPLYGSGIASTHIWKGGTVGSNIGQKGTGGANTSDGNGSLKIETRAANYTHMWIWVYSAIPAKFTRFAYGNHAWKPYANPVEGHTNHADSIELNIGWNRFDFNSNAIAFLKGMDGNTQGFLYFPVAPNIAADDSMLKLSDGTYASLSTIANGPLVRYSQIYGE